MTAGQVIKAAAGIAVPLVVTVFIKLVEPHVKAAVGKLNSIWAGKDVAILGRQQVGKTTLLDLLLGQEPSASLPAKTGDESGGTFVLGSKGTSTKFHVRHDQRGWAPENSYKAWKLAFETADYVLYLFRADLVEQRDPETLGLIEKDLNQMKAWLQKTKSVTPKIILIGTWADQSHLYGSEPSTFAQLVRTSHPIKIGATKLNNADLVVGSLLEGKGRSKGKERERLLRDLRRYVK